MSDRQVIVLRASPRLNTVSVNFAGCRHGLKKKMVPVSKATLARVVHNLEAMIDAVERARVREREPDNAHTMGFRTSSLSFGSGHFRVRGYGPNMTDSAWCDGKRVPTDLAAGALHVQFWTTARGYPAMDVLITDEPARALAAVLRAASQAPTVMAFEWNDAGAVWP